MATFTNRATLTYQNVTVTSNTTTGEILDALTLTLTTLDAGYRTGDRLTYAISLRNSGTTPLTGLTVTDDLAAYDRTTGTVVPLEYELNSLRHYQNGTLFTNPTVDAGPPLEFQGVSVPAGGNTLLVYHVLVNEFAPPAAADTLLSTAVASGGGLTAPAQDTETIGTTDGPLLSIVKAICPVPVAENGTVTYTFTIYNYGNAAADAATGAVVEDVFQPALFNLTVAFNGTSRTGDPTFYTYVTATGAFATLPGAVTVPAATFTPDPVTGAYVTEPGSAVLVITGTI